MAGTENAVREPRQARSRATREAILEAAARIVEADGEAPEAFNTNRVAAVAGVSVGTLYQYFSDKQAILVALARREILRVREGAVREEAGVAGVDDPRRRAIRALISAFPGRPRVRRASLMALMAVESAQGLAEETRRTARLLPSRPDLSPLDAYVLTRAVVGVIRAAVLEGSDHLRDPGLEDALMRLIEGYGAASAPP
jgi:AcrR family transcriptional regulator